MGIDMKMRWQVQNYPQLCNDQDMEGLRQKASFQRL